MIVLIAVFVLVWIGIIAVLTAGTLFIQGYTNESPPSIGDLAWRAPAAGSAIMAFIVIWCLLATGSPDRFASLTDFSATEERPPYDELWVAQWNPAKKTYEKDSKNWTHYARRYTARGRVEYRDHLNRLLPSRPDSVIVRENNDYVAFYPERDEAGKYVLQTGLGLRYINEDSGQVMEEGFLGQIATFHTSHWLLYLLFNLLHGIIWFCALWLLLLFPRGQAFGLALICWLVTTFLVVPPLITQTLKSSA